MKLIMKILQLPITVKQKSGPLLYSLKPKFTAPVCYPFSMKKKAFAKSHLQEGVREKCKQKPKQALFCELLYTHCTGSSVVRAYLWLAKTSQDFNDN